MYSSDDHGKIYQKKPLYTKQSLHRPKGWTETIAGYQRSAKEYTTCILRNRHLMQRPYSWAVTVSIEVVMTPAQITGLWTKASRALRRKGIEAIWFREPTPSNKVHYHLILKNAVTETQVKRVFKDALPHLQKQTTKTKRRGWHMKVQQVTDDWQLAHYVTKAKIAGYIKGQRVADYYKFKRLLFKPHLKIKKVGIIGPFWEKKREMIWQDVKDTEKRIHDGLAKPHVERLAEYLHDLIDGYFSLDSIKRSLGYWSESDEVQASIQSLLAADLADAGAVGSR